MALSKKHNQLIKIQLLFGKKIGEVTLICFT
jgi:hypothetical protein